ncbi:DUF1573 domain-containing protein [Sphingobacterium thalpophilum]|uniref:DUF1573 domain-containing protein n=1 Tax=Sphingobacterium thalpophilum TaxID=259 RepID=A0A4U9W572_9SPHI|nr:MULTISPECIES: DUF1573 domain-containing protein [Sphingobacterium]MCW8311595.1 DUF1573 domain-containing protein [Sphingobacterium sp. InxBP1]VTR53907.1 Protein of uncharacterised function (DUF1573) [Sphingobacterium thalpophilum]
MKNLSKYSVLALTAVFFVSCGNAQKGKEEAKVSSEVVASDSLSKAAAQMGKVEFEEPAFDFGQVKEGAQVKHTFILKNTGDAPVILSKVTASCGCTQPEFSKSPILPGATSEIHVTFNSEGQVGKQQKIITVQSNASNGMTTVQLKGEVLAK